MECFLVLLWASLAFVTHPADLPIVDLVGRDIRALARERSDSGCGDSFGTCYLEDGEIGS